MKRKIILFGLIGCLFSCSNTSDEKIIGSIDESCQTRSTTKILKNERIYFYYKGHLKVKMSVVKADDLLITECKTHIDTAHDVRIDTTYFDTYLDFIKKGDYTENDTISYDYQGNRYY